ncbi:MAG TPA: UDP-N-acetylmuramoyl-L-alanine--D-glutamate ligase, partial [Spirochaetia bacterium]|nr:UDP-N-acetylmuramoyl-L-alanine--D-glutamate ligase [Spirochaetia bacterium]
MIPSFNMRGKRVLLMGLGIKDGGVGAALYAARKGARLTITDIQKKKTLAVSLEALGTIQAEYRLGRHVKKDFLSADLIIKNDGVPRTHPLLVAAAARGIPI